MVKDFGYNGKNLFVGVGNELEVIFNEDSIFNLIVNLVDYIDMILDIGFNFDDLNIGGIGILLFNLYGSSVIFILIGMQVFLNFVDFGIWVIGDVVFVSDGIMMIIFMVGMDIIIVQDYVDVFNNLNGIEVIFDEVMDLIIFVFGLSSNFIVIKSVVGGGLVIDGGVIVMLIVIMVIVVVLFFILILIILGGFQVGDIIMIIDGNNFELVFLEIDVEIIVSDLVNLINNVKGLNVIFLGGSVSLIGEVIFNINSSNIDFNCF